MTPPDLILSAAAIVTMDPENRVIADGAVAISGTTLCAIGTKAELCKAYPATPCAIWAIA